MAHVIKGNVAAPGKLSSDFNQLMKLGFILMQLYFASQNKGNYGKTIETTQGIAKRGRTSQNSYFSIFGKMKVTRYLYEYTGKDACLILVTLKSIAPETATENLENRFRKMKQIY